MGCPTELPSGQNLGPRMSRPDLGRELAEAA